MVRTHRPVPITRPTKRALKLFVPIGVVAWRLVPITRPTKRALKPGRLALPLQQPSVPITRPTKRALKPRIGPQRHVRPSSSSNHAPNKEGTETTGFPLIRSTSSSSNHAPNKEGTETPGSGSTGSGTWSFQSRAQQRGH